MIQSFMFILVVGFVTMLHADSVSTSVAEMTYPTVKQLEIAKKILTETIKAAQAKDGTAVYAKLKKLQDYLKLRTVTRTYQAQLFCEKINAFSENEDADCSIAFSSSKVCYTGSIEAALRLLSAGISNEQLNWDEEWLENPRLSGGRLTVDYVDGPNEHKQTIELRLCRP